MNNKTTDQPIQKSDDEIRDLIRRNHPSGITPYALIGAIKAWADYEEPATGYFTEHQRMIAIQELLAIHATEAEHEPTGLLAH